MCTLDDAKSAYYLAMGQEPGQPMQLPDAGWEDGKTDNVFVYRDGEGDIKVKVTFTSSDGDVVVKRRSQDPVKVNIWAELDENEPDESV